MKQAGNSRNAALSLTTPKKNESFYNRSAFLKAARSISKSVNNTFRYFNSHKINKAFRQGNVYLLILLMVCQSNWVLGAAAAAKSENDYRALAAKQNRTQTADSEKAERVTETDLVAAKNTNSENQAFPVPHAAQNNPTLNTISDAAISIRKPLLNGGRIVGALRTFGGESYALNRHFQLTGDLYTAGTPNITVNNGATHGGVADDNGSSNPSGYQITLNNGVHLPGKIHTRANPISLPSDIPTTIPAATGTRTVSVGSSADALNIGDWATVKNLNVNAANQVINVSPGNYNTFTLSGSNSRLVFSAGTYNFAGTINLTNNSSIQTNPDVTINIGQNLILNNGSFVTGDYTSPGKVRLNVLGSQLTVDNNSRINALVRAVNANVNINSGVVRGQLIANYLNIGGGQIIGAAYPLLTDSGTFIYGATRFERTNGAPNVYTEQFSVPACASAPYKLRVVNGYADGSNRVSSAVIKLNNAEILSPNDLNQTVGSVERTVSLSVTNTIEVNLASEPGSFLTLTIEGAGCAPDTSAPVVAITTPLNNSTTADTAITVSGTAADAGGSGVARVLVNNAEAAFNSETGNWTLANFALNLGSNQITVKAIDRAGNEGNAQVSVTREQVQQDTTPPTVSISSPANNAVTTATTINVSGTASDTGSPASGVAGVTINGGAATYSTASGIWNFANLNLTVGDNVITARAIDAAGNFATQSITVKRVLPDTTPPAVAITLPADNATVYEAIINVSGTATDTDAGATGVSRVTVNGRDAVYDSVTGEWAITGVELALGANVIKAVAFDNAPTPNFSEVSITVTRQLPDTQAPTLSITAPQNNSETYDSTVNLAGTAIDEGTNASGVRRVLVNGTPAIYDAGTNQWSLSNVSLNIGENTFTVVAEDNAPTPNTSQAILRIIRREIPPPTVSISNPANNSTTTDEIINVAGFASANGPNSNQIATVIVNDRNASYDPASGIWMISGLPLALGANNITARATDSGGRSAATQISVTRNPINHAPQVSAGEDKAITLPNALNINGSASDDGLPQGSGLSVQWSKVSGPGDVSFVNSAAVSTSVNFSSPGIYVLRFTATDGELSASDETTINVAAQNQPPSVNAGTDQNISLPGSAALNGTATDDGLPQGSNLTFSWEKTSGAGTVVFGNQNSLNTSASFSQPGTYTLRLTASDSQLSASDEVIVTVLAANQAPTVNAGQDQTIQLPNAANLSGTVTDDGLPQGSSISIIWSKLSGPGNVSFSNPNAAVTAAAFSAEGIYELKLEAGDGALISSDSVVIQVQRINLPTVNFNVPSIGGPVDLTVVSFSNAQSSSSPANLLDESRQTAWATGSAQNANQFVKFEITGGTQLIERIRLQQSNVNSSVMVKDFIVQTSETTVDDAAFSTVLRGTLQTNDQLQEFVFPSGGTYAKYVKFIAVNTYGSSNLYLGTLQVVGAGTADNIVSLPGRVNVARAGSPSFLPNGASIVRYSGFETFFSGNYPYPPNGMFTGSGWTTKTNSNEFAIIKLGGEKSHLLSGVRIYGSQPTALNTTVKDFELWVSNTTDDDAAFSKVLDAAGYQDHFFPGGAVSAKYIKYVPKSSYGGTLNISTGGIEVLGDNFAGVAAHSSSAGNSSPLNVIDNNPNSYFYYTYAQNVNQWTKLRLEGEQPQKIYGVRIGAENTTTYGNFGPRDFQIRVSTTTADDAAFTIIHSGTLAATSAMQEIRFAQPVDAKFVQFYWVNGYSPNSWLSLHSLEALALPSDGAVITKVSSQGDANTPPARVLDLDQSQIGWRSESGQNINQNLTVRLYNGDQFTVNHVSLRPAWYYEWGYPLTGMSPKDFEIQVSTTDDADASFTTVYKGKLQEVDKLQHFYFPSASARFVRLLILNNYGHSQIGLGSFYVYAENTGGTEARFFDQSTHSNNNIVSYLWDFGDGATGTNRNAQHTYQREGVYTVTLTVTDSAGTSNTIQKIYQALPTLKADFAYTSINPVESDWFPMSVYFANLSPPRLSTTATGGVLTTNGSTSTLPEQGFFSTIYRDNGSFPATIKIGSDYVLNYSTTKNITVQNLPPIVDISDGKTVYWGENWTNPLISLSDPGPNDRSTLSGVWNYGDGQSSNCANCTATTARGAHSYALPGNYTAVLTVTDKDGGVSSDSANYAVIKRPTAVVFAAPQRGENNVIIRGTLFDAFSNSPLAGKPVQINFNGVAHNVATNGSGVFETTISLASGAQIGNIISFFAEDDLYQSSSNVYSPQPTRNNPPTGTPYNGGTDFWLAFPANISDGADSQALLITSETNTSGTVTATGCGVNQTFQVTARAITRIVIPRFCQLHNSDQIQNFGIRVTAQNPVVVYGTNERTYTSDAFLALPVNTLGKEYYALTYGNTVNFAPSSQIGVVATENNTKITIKPTVTTGTRQQGVPYQITLNQGQTYLLKNTEVGAEKDLTGTFITSDKSVAVFGGHQAATLPPPTVCCADHLVEQLPPVNTWGKRFVLVASATRTKGDFFRFVAANDNTVIYLNGLRAATINKGQFYEKLIKDPTEVISTEPIMVGQFGTSSGFDSTPTGADPFMAIVPPYSQFLNQYTISTPNRFTNYVNLAVPNTIVGQVKLDGNSIAASSFTVIGNSGFSSARIPLSVGVHNLDAPSPFGVFSYGYTIDEGYGYPGGMSLIPTVTPINLTVTPETAVSGINSQACLTVNLKDYDNVPLGGKTINLNVVGANPTSGSHSTNVSGQFEFCYTGANVGSDTITATYENVSATATFVWSPPNSAPQVFAGSDQTIVLPNNANLNGTVTDDGYPTNSLTGVWSKVSGGGVVTFANPNSASTTAAFSTEGVYVLRLTASDMQFTSSDELTVTVNPAPPNSAPTVNAGSDQTAQMNSNLVKNSSAEADLINGELPDWNEISGTNWTRKSGETSNAPAARFGEFVLAAGDEGQSELRQDIDVRAFTEAINAGTQSFEWKAFIRVGSEQNPDAGRIIFEYRDAANQNTIAALDSGAITTSDGWHLTEDARVPPAGTGFIRIRLLATRNSGATTDVFFDGLSLRTTEGGAAIKLTGAAADDGLPAGGSLTTNWTRFSGAGAVVFSNAGALDTSAKFLAPGNYVLRLTATDGQLSATDEMIVSINAANQAPAVNAGADQAISLPATATLNGTATDDGGNLRYRWTKVSGPGLVSISNAKALNPSVTFSLAGTYVLRLTAEDGELETSDEITVTVAPSPTNQPPTVDAGANQTAALPTNSVALNGAVTDDGLPNNSLSINWTKTSGAATVAFGNPNNAATSATFSAAGSYVLRLTATDGQYTVWKEVVVTIYPEGGGGANQAPTVNVGADQTITVAQTAILEAQVSDDGLPVGGSFSASWSKVSGTGNVAFSNSNQTATYANFSQTGTYVLRLTVSDSQLSASDDVTVTVVDNQPAATVEIQTPDDGISITEPTQIAGNVSGGNWKLEYSLTDTDNLNNRAWTTIATGAGAASGNLGNLDTTLMLNGLYDVRLMTTDQFGQISGDVISVTVENNLKVGHFTVSFEDMNVPVAGIPIQVARTYDSRDKRRGDFGAGWTLGIKNIRVEKNNVLGLRWYQTRSNTFIPNYCVEATRPHIVTVTMPDGKVEKFEAKLNRQCQQAAPITDAQLTFQPQAGTRGTLSVTGDNTVYVAGSVPGPVELVGYDGNGIFDRKQFKYRAKDGTEFVINQGAGLESVRDTNGNTLTVSANGIAHSSGKSISFTRDAQGRITNITDPDGQSNVYTYDAAGDLISYRDRENNTTTYTYEPTIAHHLKSIVDPLNRTPIRNEYDASGRLLKHTDAFGKEIVYTHNLAARVEIVKDRLNNETRFEYDARGNVLKKVDAKGGETVYSYDAFDNVLTETNALGKTTTYTYDAQDNRTSITDALGNKTEMTYNAKGQVLTVKDARNNTTTNTYDTAGNLLTTTNPDGKTTTNTYSIQTGLLASTKDALNNITSFEYFDGSGYLKKQTDALGYAATFAYDANGNRKSETRTRTGAQGQAETITTSFEYDNLNRLTKTVYADGTSGSVEYNEAGQQKAAVDQAGRRTQFEYDEMGRLLKTTYPDSLVEESTFDAEGKRLTSKDRAGRITKFDYDELGRLTKTTYPDSSFTETAYDAAGQVKTSKDALGNLTTFGYDDGGRRTSVKNALNETTEFTFDAAGNQLTIKDALNHTTTYEYDNLNRRTKTIFADSGFTQTTFDALGRRIEERDQAGKLTKFAYDKLSRLTKVTDALNQETVYGYNELGQQISQKDANQHTTRFEYDKSGRRVKRTLPGGQSESYSYFGDGSLKTRTDFNNKTTTYSYDSMRRLLTKTPDASLNQTAVSFTYNNLGQRQTMTDVSGVTTYDYDNRNRLQSKQTPFGTLSYTYNLTGNLKTLRSSNANGVSVDYSYDKLNRLKTVKDNRLAAGADTTSYTYDGVGNLESYSYPNAVTTSYNYNSLNRLTTLTVSNGTTNLASYAYTLGASGNREKVVENNQRTVNYSYDDLYRLTREAITNDPNANGQVDYVYDAVGNRKTRTSGFSQIPAQSFTYDENDRLTSDTYDANGNTKQSNGNNYNYDFENRLTSQSGTNAAAQFVYDGDGNRVAKTVGGVTTFYLVDTNNLTGYAQVVEELQSNVGVVKQFTFGHDLISQRIGATVSFYQYDGHGSVRQLTNQAGAITDTYTYDAFGNLINRTGTTANDYLYAGEQFDANLGFYYLRARYMNPSNGRFHSMDSYEGSAFEPVTLHKYLYANANPENNIDPSGNITLGEQLQTLAINYTLLTLTTLSNGVLFLSRNIDKLEYWWNWLEIGFTSAEVIRDITSQAGVIQFDVPNSSQTGGTGDRGEAIWIRELENKGFTDIIQIQNGSNQGIDVVARDPRGMIHFFEVKATTTNTAPGLSPDQRDPDTFIRSRLEQARNAQGQWQNVDGTNVQATATRLLNELDGNAPSQASKVSVYLPAANSTTGNFFARIRVSQWLRRRR
jgi:RHS repeat-associated protein